jgi:hypothetical protein
VTLKKKKKIDKLRKLKGPKRGKDFGFEKELVENEP